MTSHTVLGASCGFPGAYKAYSLGMDFTPYLREIEAELAQWKAVRRMLMELRETVLSEPVAMAAPAPHVMAAPVPAEPTLTIVPPKQKREYHRRARAAAEPKALGAPIPQRPVFVKPVVVAPVKAEAVVRPELDAASLEAAVRRKFLGDAA